MSAEDYNSQIALVTANIKNEQKLYQRALKENKKYPILKGHRIIINELRRELMVLEGKIKQDRIDSNTLLQTRIESV